MTSATISTHLPRSCRIDGVSELGQVGISLAFIQQLSFRPFHFEVDRATVLEMISHDMQVKLDGKPNRFIHEVPSAVLERALCWRSKRSHTKRSSCYPRWSWLDWDANPQFPDVEDSSCGRCITKFEYETIQKSGLDGMSEALRVTTVLARLVVDKAHGHDFDEGMFDVRSPRDGTVLGRIPLLNQWQRERGLRETAHFIPVLTVVQSDGSLRIKMLMCIDQVQSSEGESSGDVFERVQVMDCDISEEGWMRLAGDASDRYHLFLV